jgi:hypothetical protein
MQPVSPTGRYAVVFSALAGLETGVLGGVGLLAWLCAGSLIAGNPIWWGPVRLATAAFGSGVSGGGFLPAGVVGAALQLVAAGLVGTLFGLCMRARWALQRVVLIGLLFGLGWYYLGYEVLLRRFGLGMHGVAGRRSLLVAHLFFGLVLAAYPRLASALDTGPRSGG